MEPKEKAKDMVADFRDRILSANSKYNIENGGHPIDLKFAFLSGEQCALLCVDEILASFNSFMDSRKEFRHELEIDAERYWKSVKEEINKL